MLNYLLLLFFVVLAVFGMTRLSKQKRTMRASRRSKEPYLGDRAEVRSNLPPSESVTVRSEQSDVSRVSDVSHLSDVSVEPTKESLGAPEVIVVNLLADEQRPYQGYELLQTLLSAGLRHGKWNVFHRHEALTGRGKILFSLASSVEPGTFDLSNIGSFSTNGLSLFLRFSGLENASDALETLLQTSKELVAELGGTVCDEAHRPLSSEKVTQWRQVLNATA